MSEELMREKIERESTRRAKLARWEVRFAIFRVDRRGLLALPEGNHMRSWNDLLLEWKKGPPDRPVIHLTGHYHSPWDRYPVVGGEFEL